MERSSAIPLQAVFLAVGLGFALAACSAPAPEPSAGPATDSATTAPDTAGPEAGAASGSAGPVPADAAEDTPPDQQARCTTDPVQSLVGQEADEALVAKATALSRSTSVRVLKPGDAATMDYRGDRLNILTDEAGVVQSFNCG